MFALQPTHYCNSCSTLVSADTGRLVHGSNRHWLCNRCYDAFDNRPLITLLALNVPLEILYLKKQGGPDQLNWFNLRRYLRSRDWFTVDDNVLFGAKTRRGWLAVAERVARLSEAIAIMAFVPGGVTFGLLHFEAQVDQVPHTGSGQKGATE